MLLLVVSETGLVYTFTTPKLQPLVTKSEGKNLIQVGSRNPIAANWLLMVIQACLNAPEPAGGNENGVEEPVDSPEEQAQQQHMPPQQARAGIPQNAQMHPGYMPVDQQQALAYQNYMAQQQRSGGYPMPPQAGMPQQHAHQA